MLTLRYIHSLSRLLWIHGYSSYQISDLKFGLHDSHRTQTSHKKYCVRQKAHLHGFGNSTRPCVKGRQSKNGNHSQLSDLCTRCAMLNVVNLCSVEDEEWEEFAASLVVHQREHNDYVKIMKLTKCSEGWK